MVPQHALQPGARVVLLDLRARTLQQVTILDTGRTGGLAIQAAKTAVNVFDKRFAQAEPAFIDLQHLVNASPRRVHFRAKGAVGGAIIQAQPAVNALGVQVPCGLFAGREIRNRFFQYWRREAQSRNLPRFKMSFGSSARFTARMLSMWVGVRTPPISFCTATG